MPILRDIKIHLPAPSGKVQAKAEPRQGSSEPTFMPGIGWLKDVRVVEGRTIMLTLEPTTEAGEFLTSQLKGGRAGFKLKVTPPKEGISQRAVFEIEWADAEIEAAWLKRYARSNVLGDTL